MSLNLLVQTVQRENKCLLTLCCHFVTFWATEKAWARTPDNLNLFRFHSEVRVIRSSSYRELEKNSQE